MVWEHNSVVLIFVVNTNIRCDSGGVARSYRTGEHQVLSHRTAYASACALSHILAPRAPRALKRPPRGASDRGVPGAPSQQVLTSYMLRQSSYPSLPWRLATEHLLEAVEIFTVEDPAPHIGFQAISATAVDLSIPLSGFH